jgi:hypothetical protein
MAAMPAGAGPYDVPYALVESGWRSEVRKELPVSIHSVDGESTLQRRRSSPIAPGKHQIDVLLPVQVGPHAKQHRIVEIDAAACVRYRIVARYDNLTHIEWTPVIYAEPVGECEKKFTARKQP